MNILLDSHSRQYWSMKSKLNENQRKKNQHQNFKITCTVVISTHYNIDKKAKIQSNKFRIF